MPKQFTFVPRKFQLEGTRYKIKTESFRGTQRAWSKFIQPGLQIATPVNQQLLQLRLKILKWLEQRVIFQRVYQQVRY